MGTPEDGISFLGYSFFRTLKEIPASAFSVDRPKVAAVENSTSKKIVKPVTVVKASPKKKINSADTKTALHNDSLNNTPPIQLALNKVIKFESVRFVLSKAELLKGSYEELDMLALYLKNNLDLKVKIIGHTDYEGNWTANYTLSKQRATVVADYLKQHGVSAHRVSVEAMGPSKPVVIDDKPENREENRRVEFILSSL